MQPQSLALDAAGDRFLVQISKERLTLEVEIHCQQTVNRIEVRDASEHQQKGRYGQSLKFRRRQADFWFNL